jgi:hypothetical protein
MGREAMQEGGYGATLAWRPLHGGQGLEQRCSHLARCLQEILLQNHKDPIILGFEASVLCSIAMKDTCSYLMLQCTCPKEMGQPSNQTEHATVPKLPVRTSDLFLVLTRTPQNYAMNTWYGTPIVQ